MVAQQKKGGSPRVRGSLFYCSGGDFPTGVTRFRTTSTANTADAKPISTGVPTVLVRGDVFFWQSLQAATFVVSVTIAFVFNLFLDRFVTGFTMGAVKG